MRRGALLVGFGALGILVTLPTGVCALPSGRVYEQVSPADKGDANIIPNDQRTRASSDGDSVQFASLLAFGDAAGAGVTSEYLARREANGQWTTHGITPSQEPLIALDIFAKLEPGYVGEFSEDLSRAVFLAKSPLTNAPNVAAATNLYIRRDMLAGGAGMYELVSDATTPQDYLKPFVEIPLFASASADFSHITFESTRNLTADAISAALPTDEPKLYEWVEGSVRLAGILPADEGGGPTISQAGQETQTNARYAGGTISSDGRRVIFTAPSFSVDHTAGALYLRDDQGTSAAGDDVSVRVNQSEALANPGGGLQPATFWAASSDASVIYFTTPEQLTDDVGSGTNLYQYRLDRPVGSRLALVGTNVSGVVGASDSGSYVYFGESASLTSGDSGNRIYVWHDGVSHEVGAAKSAVEYDSLAGRPQWGSQPKSARVSPDGTHMAFVTQGTGELLSLYGKAEYNHGQSCPRFTDLACNEVYVYDATANGGNGDLQCASCNPSGVPATHDADFQTAIVGTGAAHDAEHLSRFLSDTGRYVFFNTAERLAPEDQDESVDAYQFDATTGEISLISSGTETQDEYFLDASGDGRDVFFISSAQLSATDTDHARDIYDARLGGVASKPILAPVPCRGEDCRPAAAGAFHSPEPPTAGARGPIDRADAAFPPAVLSVTALSLRQRRSLARHRTTRVVVAVSRPGSLTIRTKAWIDGRSREIGSVTRRLRQGALVRVPLRLSRRAHGELLRAGKLKLVIFVTYSQVASPQALHLTLRSQHA